MDRLRPEGEEFRRRLGDRVIWNVNSTATGGGVAEMLQALVGYVTDLAIDIRWLVIGGDAEFFTNTKRLHNRIHGRTGDDGPLGAAQAAHYAEVLADHTADLLSRVRPGDVVLLHDPQTVSSASRAGLSRGGRGAAGRPSSRTDGCSAAAPNSV